MGKSTTAAMFAEQGVPVWDADATVATLYDVGGAAVPAIAMILPEAVAEGRIQRDVLRRAIAKTPEILQKIEAAVHPLVALDRERFVREHVGAALILLDIPLYFETGAKLDAQVLVVTASQDVQRTRVLARETMTEDEFDLIRSRQLPDAEKRARADFVIETLSLEQTRQEVQRLIEQLRKT